MMEKYSYRKDQLDIIENSCIPYAIYQFIDKRVVTIAVSDGFCELYQMKDKDGNQLYPSTVFLRQIP